MTTKFFVFLFALIFAGLNAQAQPTPTPKASNPRPDAVEAGPYEGPANWSDFELYMQERERHDRLRGLGYMLSGAVATLGGLAGYNSSEDSFGRAVYAVSQTVGIAAVGYGASVYWNGNEYDSFYGAIKNSSLSVDQKTELLQRYLALERRERERNRWIQFGTSVLLAVVNFSSAEREKDPNVKGVLQFLGGVNAVIALSYTF